jgi:uncharacterized membrane protein YkoI
MLTPAQATGLAARAADGVADQVDTLTSPSGLSYQVSVTRADGSDFDVVIDARTGRVISSTAEPANGSDGQLPDAQDSQDVSSPPDSTDAP